jgi:hypothetical protein
VAPTSMHQQEIIMLESSSLKEDVGSPTPNHVERVFYYVMILLFLLISNLITKCRHSYLDLNVRRDGRDLQKIKLIRKSRTTKPWHKGSSGS